MPVRKTIPYSYGMFFITFTCYKWLPLLDIVNGYQIVYSWFDHLKSRGHYINGYVIMPNHVHLLASFNKTNQLINTIVGNGKRFMAYEIINRLEQKGAIHLLSYLNEAAAAPGKSKNKIHDVWELSFDWKYCKESYFIQQKLEYIHNNPCSKKWNLCNKRTDYPYSSARYYDTNEEGIYPVTNVSVMEDINLSGD